MVAKVVKKKKRGLGGVSAWGGSGAAGSEASLLRPKFIEKRPPCAGACPNGNLIRKALMLVSRAEADGKTYDQAMEEAFYTFLEMTPMPAVAGRVCPHPCELGCNRKHKDGSVGINNFERFIGDYGISKGLPAKKLTDQKRAEKIAVVGSGPAGLSCAYQLARRGYPVTIFEAFPKTGGMLRYGIPEYRLPQNVIDAEVKRLQDMGVEIKCNTKIGKDITLETLKKDYKAVFVGLGGHKGLKLRVEGEDASNVFSGISFLNKVSSGEKVDIGNKVVVVGGGDTAIDAARVAKRLGAEAIILYRRTRPEMPAIADEIEGALEEGVRIDFLAAPIEIYKKDGKAVGMKCQKMQLGEPDSSGRRRPVPIEGDTYDLDFTALIPAISQAPDFTGFESLIEGKDWIKVDAKGKTKEDRVYSGGDNIKLGLVVNALAHGRTAAYAIDESISNAPMPQKSTMAVVGKNKVKLEYYENSNPAKGKHVPVADRFGSLNKEIVSTLTQDEGVAEAKRCMSCGMCFECGTCWSYCQDNAIVKPLIKGEPYKIKDDFCKGCSKCAEQCPCGYIEMK
ncbi:NAD(P)-binding protein [Elusimicrobiota bacterium]